MAVEKNSPSGTRDLSRSMSGQAKELEKCRVEVLEWSSEFGGQSLYIGGSTTQPSTRYRGLGHHSWDECLTVSDVLALQYGSGVTKTSRVRTIIEINVLCLLTVKPLLRKAIVLDHVSSTARTELKLFDHGPFRLGECEHVDSPSLAGAQ